MANFKSAAYLNYQDAHTRLNHYVKITAAANDLLYNSTADKKQLSETISNLIQKAGERWPPQIIEDPQAELAKIKNDLTMSGIIWAYSAFDVFFKEIEGALSSHFVEIKPKNKKGEQARKGEEKEDDNLVDFYKKLNWSTSNIAPILPVYRFYKALRNCVAHNMGRPNASLVSISQSEAFKNAITNWPTKYPKRKISDPPVIFEDSIELRPHHAIIYSETCLRIAADINDLLFTQLGLGHFVNKTIDRHLRNAAVLSLPTCENYQKYLVCHVKNDFNISVSPHNLVYGVYTDDLKRKKEDVSRYEQLKAMMKTGGKNQSEEERVILRIDRLG